MERLAKSCRQLVWLNPLLRYEVRGPAGRRAPCCRTDLFLPVHNLKSLVDLARTLSTPIKDRPRGNDRRAAIPASQQDTWNALNDPELKACVPGCESIARVNDNEYQVQMTARVGPVSAKFRGRLSIFDVKAPNSYSLAFEGQRRRRLRQGGGAGQAFP